MANSHAIDTQGVCSLKPTGYIVTYLSLYIKPSWFTYYS